MFGIGFMELIILLGIGLFGLAGIAALFFVVRAAVRSGDRNSTDTQ